MEQVEPVTDYLKRRLREAGAAKFDAIAEAAGVTVSFIRKFVYGSRENPRIQTIQPLLDYFAAIDRGEHDFRAPRAPAEIVTPAYTGPDRRKDTQPEAAEHAKASPAPQPDTRSGSDRRDGAADRRQSERRTSEKSPNTRS